MDTGFLLQNTQAEGRRFELSILFICHWIFDCMLCNGTAEPVINCANISRIVLTVIAVNTNYDPGGYCLMLYIHATNKPGGLVKVLSPTFTLIAISHQAIMAQTRTSFYQHPCHIWSKSLIVSLIFVFKSDCFYYTLHRCTIALKYKIKHFHIGV